MKLRSCMVLPASCSGNFSATCEKVLSGAKGCARKAFALLIVFSFVLSFPVFAVKLDEYAGVISIPSQSLGIRYNSLTENTDWGFNSIPVSFEFSDDVYTFSYSELTALTGVYSQVTAGGKDFEVILSFGDGTGENVDVSFYEFRLLPYFFYSGFSPGARYFKFTGYCEIYADDDLVYTSSVTTDSEFPYIRPSSTFSVSRYLRFVYHSTADSIYVVNRESDTIRQHLSIHMKDLLVNNQPSQLDRIEISINNIGSDIDDIKVSVENIEEGVVNIEDTVTDMKEQLEDSNSNIWSAAGETITNAVTGLFVPPEAELSAKKQELEQKLDDKLGSAGDLVDVGEEFVSGVMGGFGRDDIGNGYQFQFPGITFPMNGEEYVIIPAQTVKLNNRAFVIFQDALGFAVTAICFFSIIHICEDALYCLISGVSYWGFIRSRHDK